MEIQKICSLCLKKCENFKWIQGNTKDILDLFLPQMDFTIIEGPVMCENCEEMLTKCFDFKATCLYTHDYLVPFVSNKGAVKLDLKDVYLSKNVTVTGVPEDRDICGCCMELVKNCYAIALDVEDEECVLQKMVAQCLPELDLGVIKKPVICADCHGSLESCFRFVKNCLTVEEKIKRYHENLDINSKGQIELSGLIFSTIGSVKTSDIDSNSGDITKVKQIYASEMVSGVNVIKLEQMPRINENFGVRIENKNESSMALDIPKVNTRQPWSPKNVLVLEEKSNELSATKIEQTLFEENKHTDETFGDIEDKKCLLNEEIEIKTDKDDLNRLEEGIIITHLSANKASPEVISYKCGYCTYQTNHKQEIIAHVQNHDASRIYKCGLCTYQTNRKDNLKRHLLKHKGPSEVTMYKCDSCAYQSKYKQHFKTHVRNHKYPPPMYKCDACIYQTKYKQHFKTHVQNHKYPPPMYKCDSCIYQTQYKKYFNRHLRKHQKPNITM